MYLDRAANLTHKGMKYFPKSFDNNSSKTAKQQNHSMRTALRINYSLINEITLTNEVTLTYHFTQFAASSSNVISLPLTTQHHSSLPLTTQHRQLAARNGNVDMLGLLREWGGYIFSRGPMGDTLLHLAANNGSIIRYTLLFTRSSTHSPTQSLTVDLCSLTHSLTLDICSLTHSLTHSLTVHRPCRDLEVAAGGTACSALYQR